MPLSRAEVENLVKRYVARVREQIPVEAVYVYGSYAHGHPHEYSDIDVAVISPGFPPGLHQALSLLSRARRPDAGILEPLPFTSEEYHDLPPGSFLGQVVKHGWRII
jgi:uncharacterized protein